MNNQSTDVIIYTPKAVENEVFAAIAEKIKRIDGVVQFEQNVSKPNLIMVRYVTDKIKAITILNKFNRSGFRASLVGM